MLFEVKTTKEVDVQMRVNCDDALVIRVNNYPVAFFTSDGEFIIAEDVLKEAGFTLGNNLL